MTQPGQRLTHVVWVSTAALLVLLLAVTAGWLESGRRQALAKAEAAVRQVVAAAEADVNRNVMAVDLTLAGLPKVLAPASIPGGFDAEAAHAALSALHERHLLFTDKIGRAHV